MTADNDKYWFRAKTYGWGWGLPVRWQGWVVLLSFVLLSIGGICLVGGRFGAAALLLYFALLIVALIAICWRTGERPRWRWGR